MPSDAQYMQEAIEQAMLGRGRVEPNPMVGCILVKDGQIIARGHHQKFGAPHAEPNAIAATTAPVAGSTAYVTLEPCCHEGKKTPPCAPLLIKSKIARVVIGTADPNPQVNGKGIAMLRSAGIAVEMGILEPDCRQLLAPFHAWTTLERPYVTLKWAETSDGKVAGPGGRPVQITSPQATHAVHQLRSDCDAILVGVQTIRTDNPQLTIRHVQAHRPLLRCVLDRDLKTPPSSRLLASAGSSPVVIYCSRAASTSPAAIALLKHPGVSLMPLPAAPQEPARLSLPALLADLRHRDVMHLLVEPGPKMAESFFKQQTVDRAWILQSSQTLAQRMAAMAATPHPASTNPPLISPASAQHVPPSLANALSAAAIPAPTLPPSAIATGLTTLGTDQLAEWLIGNSDAYFATLESADLLRARHGAVLQ